MSGTAIMNRASICEIEAYRNEAIALFAEAYDKVEEAGRLAALASPSGVFDLPTIGWRNEWKRDRSEYLERVRRTVDRGVWSHLIHVTGLSTLMDKTAREDFRKQLDKDPPSATAENCWSTLTQLGESRGLIFQRGIATAFSSLDRRFRSHDGFKIGSRIILSNAFNDFGSWNSWRRHDETLVDVQRAFHVLDGKRPPERHAGILGTLYEARPRGSLALRAYVAEDEYFRVRVFANGNAHVWFKRADLVERVNALLADYYGEVLGARPDVADREVKDEPRRSVARNFGFFPSPEGVVRRVMEAASISSPMTGLTPQSVRVLEPNAGTGALARPAAEAGHEVTCVELQPHLADALATAGIYRQVITGDFLDQTPEDLGLFAKIVMNPPFDAKSDLEHVSHAFRFLAPGGLLVAVMSAGTEFRQDRRTTSFRERIAALGGRFTDLPPGSFAEAGTNVNTTILTVRAPQ